MKDSILQAGALGLSMRKLSEESLHDIKPVAKINKHWLQKTYFKLYGILWHIGGVRDILPFTKLILWAGGTIAT